MVACADIDAEIFEIALEDAVGDGDAGVWGAGLGLFPLILILGLLPLVILRLIPLVLLVLGLLPLVVLGLIPCLGVSEGRGEGKSENDSEY